MVLGVPEQQDLTLQTDAVDDAQAAGDGSRSSDPRRGRGAGLLMACTEPAEGWAGL